jgi:hypothetical protein
LAFGRLLPFEISLPLSPRRGKGGASEGKKQAPSLRLLLPSGSAFKKRPKGNTILAAEGGALRRLENWGELRSFSLSSCFSPKELSRKKKGVLSSCFSSSLPLSPRRGKGGQEEGSPLFLLRLLLPSGGIFRREQEAGRDSKASRRECEARREGYHSKGKRKPKGKKSPKKRARGIIKTNRMRLIL